MRALVKWGLLEFENVIFLAPQHIHQNIRRAMTVESVRWFHVRDDKRAGIGVFCAFGKANIRISAKKEKI